MALHAPLLRELVHALLGDWGDVFMTGDEREGDGAEAALPTVRLNPAVAAWLPRPDAGELLSLAAVGAVYAQLDDGNAGAGAGATATTTAAALFAGVDAALDPYRATVLALEQRVLDESRPPPGLAEVRLALGEWPTLLPALAALAADAASAPTAGAAAALLDAASRGGWPALEDAAAALAARAAAAELARLEAWCVDGALDAGADFFVVVAGSSGGGDGGRALPEPPSTPPRAARGDGFLSASSGSFASASDDSDDAAWSSDSDDGDDGGEGWGVPVRRGGPACASSTSSSTFIVALAALPPYIPLAAAEDAVAAGTAARALARARPTADTATRAAADADADRADIRSLIAEDAPPQPVFVEAVLARVRERAEARVWAAVGGVAGVRAAVGAVASFALFRDAALWDAFVRDTQAMMATLPGPGASAALAAALGGAALAARSALPGPPLRLRLAFDDAPGPDAHVHGWDGRVRLAAETRWPLAAALPPGLLQAADALFRLMLRVKRATAALDRACGALKTTPRSPLWRVHAVARAAITAAGCHLSDDVVDPALRELEGELAAADGLAGARRALARAARALAGGSLAWDAPTQSLLAALSGACHRLAALAEAGDGEGDDGDGGTAAAVSLADDIDRRVALLRAAAAAAAAGGGEVAPHARTLVLRLRGGGEEDR